MECIQSNFSNSTEDVVPYLSMFLQISLSIEGGSVRGDTVCT